MASSSRKVHVRSNSLPSVPHPSTLTVNEEWNKLRVLEASNASTSESIYKGLSGLEGLYTCTDDLLNLASTQQVLSQHGHQKCVEELLDGSVRILDVCESTRDMLVQIKEHVKCLQSALRRRKGDSSILSSIDSFISFRKNMKKFVKKLTITLKQMDTKYQAMDLDNEGLAVIGSLREVSSINASMFESLLVFLSASELKPKSSKWSLVTKLMHKQKVACEAKFTSVNELENLDVALLSLRKFGFNNDKMQAAKENLEALDMSIQCFENSLESLYRRIIKTRASFLNILSL